MSRLFLRGCIYGLLIAVLGAGSAMAQGKGQGKGKGHNKHQDQDNDDNGSKGYGFSRHDREIISGYYAHQTSNLPPGLAKRNGNLPPGLEKQLERNGTLPPGLQKRVEPCPAELERQLPTLPPDYRRGVIGAHVVVFNRNTNVIVDVVKDVVR